MENVVPTRRGVWMEQPTRGKDFDLLFLPEGAAAAVRVPVSRLLPIGMDASADGSRLFLVRMQEFSAAPMVSRLKQ